MIASKELLNEQEDFTKVLKKQQVGLIKFDTEDMIKAALIKSARIKYDNICYNI